MIIHKRYSFQCDISSSSSSDAVTYVEVIERLDDENYPIFTWPSSVLLAAFLYQQSNEGSNSFVQINSSTKVIELGSGTALPSLLCAKMGVSHCLMSERKDQSEMLQHIQDSIDHNNVSNSCVVYPLSWGYDTFLNFDDIPIVDLILGADIFYSAEDYDSILFTVFQLLVRNPKAVFLTTYQERDSHHSIEHLLARYGLLAEHIPQKEFMHSLHNRGECTLSIVKETMDSHSIAESFIAYLSDLLPPNMVCCNNYLDTYSSKTYLQLCIQQYECIY